MREMRVLSRNNNHELSIFMALQKVVVGETLIWRFLGNAILCAILCAIH